MLIEPAMEAAFGANPLPCFRQPLALAAASLAAMGGCIAACRISPAQALHSPTIATDAQGEHTPWFS